MAGSVLGALSQNRASHSAGISLPQGFRPAWLSEKASFSNAPLPKSAVVPSVAKIIFTDLFMVRTFCLISYSMTDEESIQALRVM